MSCDENLCDSEQRIAAKGPEASHSEQKCWFSVRKDDLD